jgi:amino acid adenylation domain-containing protein
MTERIEELLRTTAARQPGAVALVMGERRLTYRELSERVNGMAAAVAAANKGGGPVAVHAAKTIETVVCMMGCLVAGVPYVPVDASLPPARRAVVLDRAGSTLFLYDRTEVPATPGVTESSADVVDISSLAGGQADGRPAAERSEVAYILFTSGSTGTPKGVIVTHANLLSAIGRTGPRVGWAPEGRDRVLCYAPLHFDIYPTDVYGAMAVGATVVLADDRSILFPQATADLVANHGITFMMAVPSAWIALLRLDPGDRPDPLVSLRRVIYSGEEFPANWLRKLAERLPQARIINIYGLVETTPVIGLEVRAEHLALDRIPLGYPLGTNRVFLLGDDGVPLTGSSAQGEIAVHGPGLSPCYLHDHATTEAAWTEIIEADGTRLACFRTGDFGEYGDDGIIHFRGRRDARIKTRGHRVELGDVEAALASHPSVVRAVAVPRPHADVTNELVAFAESHDVSLGERELISWARQLLPAYMVPRKVVVTNSLPRTATGKADRQALLRQVSVEAAPNR